MRVMALCNLVTVEPGWRADWVWGLSLVVLTVILHVPCLGLIRVRALRSYTRTIRKGLNTTRVCDCHWHRDLAGNHPARGRSRGMGRRLPVPRRHTG